MSGSFGKSRLRQVKLLLKKCDLSMLRIALQIAFMMFLYLCLISDKIVFSVCVSNSAFIVQNFLI